MVIYTPEGRLELRAEPTDRLRIDFNPRHTTSRYTFTVDTKTLVLVIKQIEEERDVADRKLGPDSPEFWIRDYEEGLRRIICEAERELAEMFGDTKRLRVSPEKIDALLRDLHSCPTVEEVWRFLCRVKEEYFRPDRLSSWDF